MTKEEVCDVSATLTFLADLPIYDKEKLYEIWADDAPSEIPRTNAEFSDRENILIHDVRAKREACNLETTGFAFLNHQSMNLPKTDELLGKEPSQPLAYLNEVIELVKDYLQPDRVICFDWRYRKSQPRMFQNQLYENKSAERKQALNVATIIHSDDSQAGGLLKLQRYLTPSEYEEFQQGKWRVRFINVWRPLNHCVEDAPLAFCDRRTVRKDDFHEVDKIHDEYIGENNYLKHRDDQKWYYLSSQQPWEPSMFVTWDSAVCSSHPEGPPHTAFDNPMAKPGAPKRESIEVRTLVMTRQ